MNSNERIYPGDEYANYIASILDNNTIYLNYIAEILNERIYSGDEYANYIASILDNNTIYLNYIAEIRNKSMS